jgi:hypothetical protein
MTWFIFFLPMIAAAQVDMYGYYESEYDYMQFHESNYNYGYNKLRLDLESRPSDQVMIAGNINFKLYNGKTEWDIFDFFTIDTVEFNGEEITSFPISFLDVIYLDNIYIRTTFSKFDLTIGRQPLSLGTGYAWNPLDIFNRKELIDPTYEQPSINALRLEIPLQDRTLLDAIILPDSTWEMSTKMIQLKTGLGSFDISFNGAYQHQLVPNAEAGYTYDQIYSAGGAFVGEFWEFGFWGETLWPLDVDDDFGEIVLGTDHTLDNGLYFMCEYFHNSLGADEDDLQFDHYIYNYSGATHSLMKNYIFAMGMFKVTDYIYNSMVVFGNLDDKSYMLAPQIDWEVFEDVMVGIWLSQSIGDEDTEFGIQNRAVRFRIRAYF